MPTLQAASRVLAAWWIIAASVVGVSQAQGPAPASPRAVPWWAPPSTLAGAAAISLVDQPVRDWVRSHRSAPADHIAWLARQLGEPRTAVAVTLGIFGAGLLGGDGDVQRAALRIGGAVAGAGLSSEVALKYLVGRSRPDANEGSHHFRPGRFDTSFPSGHTAVAFALATTLAHEIDSDVATVALLTIAAGTAWSRVYHDRHWLSDVLVGALIGITAGQIAEKQWSLYGIGASKGMTTQPQPVFTVRVPF